MTHLLLYVSILLSRIGHDAAGLGSGWHLDKVEIVEPYKEKAWAFPCGKWLASDEEDGEIERELFPSGHETVEIVKCKTVILVFPFIIFFIFRYVLLR